MRRAGILDIRIWNTDRHAGNILVRRPRGNASTAAGLGRLQLGGGQAMELVPIDHGFCLPEALDPPYLEWLHWPAVRPGACPSGVPQVLLPLWDCPSSRLCV